MKNIFLAALFVSVPVMANEDCSVIPNDQSRLACYDSIPGAQESNRRPWAGPLGVEGGLTVDQLSEFIVLREHEYFPFEDGAGIYKSNQAPKMTSIAEEYSYWFDEGVLVSVVGHYTSRFAREELLSLMEKYGRPENSEKELSLSGSSVTTFEYNRDNAVIDDSVRLISVRISDHEDDGVPDRVAINYHLKLE